MLIVLSMSALFLGEVFLLIQLLLHVRFFFAKHCCCLSFACFFALFFCFFLIGLGPENSVSIFFLKPLRVSKQLCVPWYSSQFKVIYTHLFSSKVSFLKDTLEWLEVHKC